MRTYKLIVMIICVSMITASCTKCNWPEAENTNLFIENYSSHDLTLSNSGKSFPSGSKTLYTAIHCDNYSSTIRQRDILFGLGDTVTVSFSDDNYIQHIAILNGDSILFIPSHNNILDSSSWNYLGEGIFSYSVHDDDLRIH